MIKCFLLLLSEGDRRVIKRFQYLKLVLNILLLSFILLLVFINNYRKMGTQ